MENLKPNPNCFFKRLGTALRNIFQIGKAKLKSNEALVGWRILSAVDEIIPGKSAKTRAQNWESTYSSELIMLEMMAQTGGLIVGSVHDFTGNVVFAKVENAEFVNPILKTEFVVEATAKDGVSEAGSWVDAEVKSGNNVIASARFFLIDAGDLSGTGKSLTFHLEFLKYYRVREKMIK